MAAYRPLNISGGGKTETSFDCEYSNRWFSTTCSIWVSGLTVSNGYSSDEGGVLMVSGYQLPGAATVALSDVAIFTSASSDGGGGLSICSFNVILDGVDIIRNWAMNGNGGGVLLAAPSSGLVGAVTVRLTSCRIEGNYANSSGM